MICLLPKMFGFNKSPTHWCSSSWFFHINCPLNKISFSKNGCHTQIPHSDTSDTTLRYLSHFDVIGCILLGSFATLAIFFATTTFYYRKKARTLQYGGKVHCTTESFLS